MSTPNVLESSASASGYDYIENKELRILFEREADLMKTISDLSASSRTVQKQRSVYLAKTQSFLDKEREVITAELEALLKKKEALNMELRMRRVGGNDVSLLRDRVELLDNENGILRARLRRMQDALKKDEQAVAQKQQIADAKKETLEYTTLEDAKSALSRTQNKLKDCKATNGAKDKKEKKSSDEEISRLENRCAVLTQALADINYYEKLKSDVMTSRTALETKRSEMDLISERLKELESERKTISDGIRDAQAEQGKTRGFTSVRSDLAQLESEIEALKKKRRNPMLGKEDVTVPTAVSEKNTKNNTSNKKGAAAAAADPEEQAAAAAQAEIQRLNDSIKASVKELKEIRANIYEEATPFDISLVRKIVGAHARKIKEFQTEFDVHISAGSDGVLNIRGMKDSVIACMAKCKEFITDLKDHQFERTINFDIALSKEVIGPRGKTVETLQKTHDVRININTVKGIITITGTEKGTQNAFDEIHTIISQSHYEELIIPSMDLIVAVLGRQSQKQLDTYKKEFSLKSVRLQRDRPIIELVGTKENVRACTAKIQERIQTVDGHTARLIIQPKLVPVVIGKGGATIRDLEERSGAFIEVRETQVILTGTQEAVAAARKLVRDITNRDEVRIPVDASLASLITREFLDELKDQSNCTSASLIYQGADRVVVVRGDRDNLRQVKTLYDMKLLKLQVTIRSIPFSSVLFTFVKSIKDDVMKNCKGLELFSVDRINNTITINGDSVQNVDAAQAEIERLLKAETEKIHLEPFRANEAPILIGTRGATIQKIVSESGALITLNRETSQIELYGSEENIQKALVMIQKERDLNQARFPPRQQQQAAPAATN